MFFSGQGTTNTENLFLTHIWESKCLGMGAYLHCVVNSSPCHLLVGLYQYTSLSCQPFLTLISFMLFILILIHQFSLFILCGSCLALGFVLSCSKGQDALVSFPLLTAVHVSNGKFERFNKLPSGRYQSCQSNISWYQSLI